MRTRNTHFLHVSVEVRVVFSEPGDHDVHGGGGGRRSRRRRRRSRHCVQRCHLLLGEAAPSPGLELIFGLTSGASNAGGISVLPYENMPETDTTPIEFFPYITEEGGSWGEGWAFFFGWGGYAYFPNHNMAQTKLNTRFPHSLCSLKSIL